VLKGLDIPRMGQNGIIGVLTTKTLVIAGDPLATTTPIPSQGGCCTRTTRRPGKEVGAVFIPGRKRARHDVHAQTANSTSSLRSAAARIRRVRGVHAARGES